MRQIIKQLNTWKLPDLGGKKLAINRRTKYAIADIVAKIHGISRKDITMNSRKVKIVRPRQQAMWFYRNYTSISYREIGEILGGKDHATALNGFKRINNDIDINFRQTRIELIEIFSYLKKIIWDQTKYGEMKVAYICHPISGDIDGNVNRILQIIREININEPTVVPFAPYISDVLAMPDTEPAFRTRGIKNDHTLINLEFIHECRIYGDTLSGGMIDEITEFKELNIPVIPMNDNQHNNFKRIFNDDSY